MGVLKRIPGNRSNTAFCLFSVLVEIHHQIECCEENQGNETILKPVAVFHGHSVCMQEDKMKIYARKINDIPLGIACFLPIFQNPTQDKDDSKDGKK